MLLWLCYSVCFVGAQNSVAVQQDWMPDHDVLLSPFHVKAYSINKVIIDILDKRDNEMLKDYQKRKIFSYDSLGNHIALLYTFPSVYGNIYTTAKVKDGRVLKRESAMAYDSTMQYFEYNSKHQVTKSVQGNGLQFYTYLYAYDSLYNIKSRKKVYEVCKLFDQGVCEPEYQKLLFEEYYNTQRFSAKQSKTTVLNDEKRAYKEIIRNYNEHGQILTDEERYLLSPFYTKYLWTYNDKHELISKQYFKEELEQWKMEFVYDASGQLSAEKIYKTGQFTNEIMYVYEGNTGVLNSYINRDNINKSMQIYKVSYVLK
jgi:hypothetical protein